MQLRISFFSQFFRRHILVFRREISLGLGIAVSWKLYSFIKNIRLSIRSDSVVGLSHLLNILGCGEGPGFEPQSDQI